MGTQKTKEAPKEEVQAGEKQESPERKEKSSKKWKGKDWFTVVTGDVYEGREIGEVPATDPQSLINRKVSVSLSQLTGNPSKYYIRLDFQVNSVDGDVAVAGFAGMKIAKDQVFRMVRKRTSRVDLTKQVATKDGWLLHLKIISILNKSVEMEIQRKVRARIDQILEEISGKSSLGDFIMTICDELLQKNIKKYGSKIYPIRFCEVAKIEVRKKPSLEAAKPSKAKA